STDPTPNAVSVTRTVTWVINDGAANNAAPPTTVINLNATPVIHDLGGDISTYTESGPAVLLDDSTAPAPQIAATVTDDQANFNNGSLTVSITGNKLT